MSSPFLERLRTSRLLSPEQWERFRRAVEAAGIADRPEILAEGLHRKEWLTPWQAEQLLAGRTAFFFGHYKLLDRIGAGGMGSVFRAEDVRSGRIFALKVLQDDRLGKPGATARFRREIQAVSRLRHPHVVAAVAADRIGAFHYLVMEYVPGRDLSRLLKEQRVLPLRWSCECIRQAATALEHIRKHGFVHRDIKPGNLLVLDEPAGQRPFVKIIDLGLVRFLSEDHDDELTDTGQILGTPDYIAPEQARNTHKVDTRADIFSLGCTLYRMLTGRWAFEGNTPLDRLMARYTQDAPPLRLHRPDAPPGLEAVVKKMLARDPAERFPTPEDTAAALASYAWPESRTAPKVTATEPSAAPPPREPGPAPAAPSATKALEEVPSWRDASDAGTGSRTAAFLSSLNAREAARQASADVPTLTTGGVTAGAADAVPVEPGTVDFEWFRVPDLGPPRRPPPEPTRGAVWVWAAGGMVATVLFLAAFFLRPGPVPAAPGGLVLDWPAADRVGAVLTLDGRPVSLVPGPEIRLSVSPGTHRLHGRRPGWEDIELEVGIASREEVRVPLRWREGLPNLPAIDASLTDDDEAAIGLSVDRDGRTVLRTTAGGRVEAHSPEGSATRTLAAVPGVPFQAICDGDGRWAAILLWTGDGPNRLYVQDLRSDRRPLEWPLDRPGPTAVAWNGDRGTRLTVGFADGHVEVRSHDGRRTAPPQAGHTAPVTVTATSADGRYAATAAADGVRLWDLVPTLRAGEFLKAPAGPNPPEPSPLQPWRLAFSPDGGHLAVLWADRTVRVWDRATARVAAEIPAADRETLALAFSPAGRFLAYGGRDDLLHVVDWRTGREAATLPVGDDGPAELLWNGSGLWSRTIGGDIRRRGPQVSSPLRKAVEPPP